VVRLDCRNVYRFRNLTTQVGDIDLQIPKLRQECCLPSIHEPRRRVDQGPSAR
jgi:transposase-like protein